MIPTATDNRKVDDKSGVFDHVELEGTVLGDCTMTDNQKWQYRRFKALVLPFWDVRRCCNHLTTLLSS